MSQIDICINVWSSFIGALISKGLDSPEKKREKCDQSSREANKVVYIFIEFLRLVFKRLYFIIERVKKEQTKSLMYTALELSRENTHNELKNERVKSIMQFWNVSVQILDGKVKEMKRICETLHLIWFGVKIENEGWVHQMFAWNDHCVGMITYIISSLQHIFNLKFSSSQYA